MLTALVNKPLGRVRTDCCVVSSVNILFGWQFRQTFLFTAVCMYVMAVGEQVEQGVY